MAEFAAYYLVWTLVRNMNIVFAIWLGQRIRSGWFSMDLLRRSIRSAWRGAGMRS
jgi:ABC-type uncharacterized transport system permease subunit